MRRNALFWGTVVVLIGVLLLLDAFVPVDLGKIVWPLLLIALGLWVLWGIFTAPRTFETEEVAIPLEGATKARIRFRHGAGRLRVSGGAGPDELAAGSFGGGMDHRVRREGDELNVEMRSRIQGPHFVLPWMWGPSRTLDWSVELNGDIPLSLDLETGASDARLDLAGLRVTDLRVQTGASATDITLPSNAGHTKVVIRSGAAAVKVRVPEGVAARIRARGGLAGITINKKRFPRLGNAYQSEDYDTAPNKVDVDIETGVGAVDVR